MTGIDIPAESTAAESRSISERKPLRLRRDKIHLRDSPVHTDAPASYDRAE
jgi:hypothetical protein